MWAAAPEDGLVWRIEPGGHPPARTIVSVGRGVVALAFGEGALWAANYADGTIARIDPATNEVTRTADAWQSPGDRRRRGVGVGQRRGGDDRRSALDLRLWAASSRAGKAQTC